MAESPSEGQAIKPNVARAGWIMMASLLLSRILGTVRDIVASAMFGQDLATDAYRISFQIPDLLFFLVAGGALSSAFIPVFSEYLHTGREKEAWHVFSSVTTIMAAIVGGLILLLWVFAPQASQFVAGGKSAEIVPMVVTMSRIVLPAQFAFFIGGLMFGTLYARQTFSVPGLAPNIYNLGIIAGAVTLGHVLQPGVSGMSWGALAGALIGNLLIPAVVLAKIGVKYRPTFDTSHPGVRKVFKLMLPVVLGLSLPGVFALILQYFGTFFEDGVNSALDSANRLMQAPLGIFGQSLALAAFPALSQFKAQGQMEAFRDQLQRTMGTVMFLSVPVSALLFAMPDAIIRALLEHGKFTAEDTARTAPALGAFALGVAAWCLHPLLMRAYFATQTNVRPIVIGTIATVAFVSACLVNRSTGGTYTVFALCGSATATALVVAMFFDVQKVCGKLQSRQLGTTLAKSVLASIPAALVGRFCTQVLNDLTRSKMTFVVGVAVTGLLCAWIYYAMARLLGMSEASTVSRALNRKRPAV